MNNEENLTETITNNDSTTASMLDSFLVADDVTLILSAIILFTCIGFLVNRLIVFIPDFMVSLIKKVKNTSIIYSNDNLDDPKLDTSLDKSDFGFKNLLDRWFK